MESIYNRSWVLSTHRADGDKILCTTSLLDNFVEKKAIILAKTSDFTILSAEVETLSGLSEEANNTIQRVPQLLGKSAYSNDIGKAIRSAFVNDRTDHHKSILLETIRGILMSRSFFIKESGFSDEQDYYQYWAEKLKNTCFYQSNQDIVGSGFIDRRKKLGINLRSRDLFLRMHNLNIYRTKSNLVCNSVLIDTYHQINLVIELDQNFTITTASGQIMRSPHLICNEACKTLNKLAGYSLCPEKSLPKTIRELVAGSDGCFYLGNLTLEIADCLDLLSM